MGTASASVKHFVNVNIERGARVICLPAVYGASLERRLGPSLRAMVPAKLIGAEDRAKGCDGPAHSF
jgi:hypothetical protein